jgi:GH25 family lysozyme M1 (1,4-beta-N-acetylmuramidase)
MTKFSAQRPVLGIVGLFSALLLANHALTEQVHADTNQSSTSTQADAQASSNTQSSVTLKSSTPTTSVTTQAQAAGTIAEAAFQLTNQHDNSSAESAGNRSMGSILNTQALAALTDETGSTSTKHILRAPAGLDEATSAKWLTIAKQQAAADQAKTGRSQQIIMVADTAPTLKAFAIGDTSVPDVDAVDVASYQSWMTQTEYKQLKAKGVKTVIVKLTQGTGYVNPYAETQIKYAKAAGLNVAVYHFATFNSAASAKSEAQHLVSALQSAGLPKTTRVFADMEDKSTNVSSVGSNLKQFWATMSASGYTDQAVYTGGSWGTTYSSGVVATVGDDRTWYAAYPYTPTASSTLSSFKGFDYGAWQFSSTAYLSGHQGNNIDVSDDYSGVLTNMSSSGTSTQPAQGPWLTKSGYIKVKSPNYDFWTSFNFTNSTDSAVYNGQELVVNGMYHHTNGSTYYSVYTKAGKWLGYLNANAATWEGEQGEWHKDDRYVAITHRYDTYSDFGFKKLHAAGSLTGQTFHSTGKYYHLNGSTYLSLYKSDGTWMGYINQNAVTVTDKNGVKQATSGYITFGNANKTGYSNLNDTAVKTSGAKLSGHTYKVTGQYRSYSGKLQYSVYTLKNQWLGYVDGNGVKLTNNAQGQWVAKSGYFTTTVKGQTMWSSFAYHGGNSTTSYYQQTYKINGVYYHSNGAKYYSLYNNTGKWMGYINAANGTEASNAGGAWIKTNQKVKLTHKGYPIWQGFFSNQVNTTTALYGKTYTVTGHYHHYNGSWYDSLYSGKTWIGYVNAAAVSVQ